LKEITNIVSYKKGHEGINHYTLHYTIRAEFKHHAPMLILESASRSKIVKQVSYIITFIVLAGSN
jgi:hypothetical protein